MAQPLFKLDARQIARIALPLPVDELFEYSIPAALEERARPGCRAQVRLRDRELTGVIVERSHHSRFPGRLLPIQSVVDLEPVLSPTMMELLRDAADELLCPLGIALATALPAGSAPRSTAGYAITERGRTALAAGAVAAPSRAPLEALFAEARSQAQLSKLTVLDRLTELERDGLVVRTSIAGSPRARRATVRSAALAPGVDAESAASTILSRAPQQAALLRYLAASGELATASLQEKFPSAASLLRQLAKRELIQMCERHTPRDVLGKSLEADRQVSLTASQAHCLEPIASAVRSAQHETFLLHGVTGSGKTEIYLRAVREALSAGRQALVLVPEITLTHQILARLRGRFGDNLAVLHSGLRPGERLEQWERLRAGSTPIAVGARSALFAPLEKLGVIVIDEEHDSAYKNDEGFRYHARDLAQRRGMQAISLSVAACRPAVRSSWAQRRPLSRLVSPRTLASFGGWF